jgi:YVTN family beta-propeller protein
VVASTAAGGAEAPTVVARIKVAATAAPCAAAAGSGAVWVSEYGRPFLLRIDPKTNKVVSRVGIGLGSCGLGFGAGSLWVEDTSSSTVSRVSVATRKRVAIRVGLTPYDATFAYGAAWTTAYGDGELDRIDPARNRVVKRIALPAATGVVGAFGSIWATGSDGVIRVDPATDAVTARIPLSNAAWTAASTDAVWITSPQGLVRIDPKTNAIVATVPLGGVPLGDPAVVGGLVWVPKIRQNTVALVDPATNRVTAAVKVGTGPFVVTEIRGEAWVPSWKGADIWRLRP